MLYIQKVEGCENFMESLESLKNTWDERESACNGQGKPSLYTWFLKYKADKVV